MAVVLASLIAGVALVLGLVLSDGSQSRGPSPGLRLVSPEEAAAVTRSAAEQPADSASTGEPLVGGQDPQSDQTAASQGPAPLPPPSPELSDDLSLVFGVEPVVAVAQAVTPSVVRVEVESELGTGLGSGIVWDAESGYIVTNQHVVAGADQVRVTFSDGTRVDGEILGGSPGHDVAVIRVDPEATELVAATFAPTSSVRVGQLAVAIGSPFGLTGTVTAGIVSAVRIQISDPSFPVPLEMIQTDAAINSGNSGGALADWQGRVIGMNTLIRTTSGGSIGLGFAVPSDTVELIAARVVNGESLDLGYLGISSQSEQDDAVGVTIIEVVPDSPADEAGLEVGDVILALDGEPVYDITELSALVKLRRPGERVELTIQRDVEVYAATVVLGTLG